MVTSSMIGNGLRLRRTVDLGAGGDREAASSSVRSIVADARAAGIRGWYRAKITSPGAGLRWVKVEAIDETGVPIRAFIGSVSDKDFSSWLYVGASIRLVRLSAVLSEPGDAAMSATLRPVSLVEFVWRSVFPRTSWRPQLPENESGFLQRPAAFLRSYLHPPTQFIAAFRFPRPSPAAAREEPEPEPAEFPILLREGLCIIGYLRSEIGLGQAARNLAYACDSRRLPLSFRNLPLAERQNDLEFATKCNQVRDRKANLLIAGLASLGMHQHERSAGRLNVVYPFWELGKVRREWLAEVRRFDEVWAPSAFVASAFAGTLGRPVRLVHQPVRLPAAVPPPRSGRDTLRLFTYLDFDSYGERKNPTGTVNAFQAAFKPAQRDVELIIKVRGADSRGLRQWLGKAAAADPRIKVIDRTLDRTQMDALMADCDAFVSLHRSEGFGFGAAEALAAGKAVVATDYGGTTDFISPATGYPVDYTLVAVKPGEYIDADGQVWAAPRQDAAAAALQSIYQDPADAYARTVRGFAVLHAQSAPAVVGAQIERLLRDAGVL